MSDDNTNQETRAAAPVTAPERTQESHPHQEGGYRSDDRGQRPGMGRGKGGRGFFRKKVCRFCTQKLEADYKNPEGLRRFVTERGKILPRRITGTCAKHQRALAREVKKARVVALLPYVKK